MARRFDPAVDSYGVEVSSPRELSAPAIGTLRKVTGSVTVKRAKIIAEASPGDFVYQGDIIETGVDGSATISFVDGNTFYLRPGTVMVLSVPTGDYCERGDFPALADLIGLDRILSTLPRLVSRRFEGGLYPIELANGIASLSSYPSAKVLQRFLEARR